MAGLHSAIMAFKLRAPTLPLLAKLILFYLVPALALFSLFGYASYELARDELEKELGTRLADLAAATATQIRGRYLLDLIPGDEEQRAYLNVRRKLEAVRSKTLAARIYVFKPDGTSLCDTFPEMPIGSRYYRIELDRHELAEVFASGAAVSSVLFRGKDDRFYKVGYAPVAAADDDPRIVAAIGVEAPASFFERLVALRRHILRSGALLGSAVVFVSILVATLLTRPIRKLASFAERIGKGDLGAPAGMAGRDEIGMLGRTLEEMRQALRARDERLRMMLAGIAHEVRNPLAGMELFAGILREELAEDKAKLGHLSRIERELGHLKTVVNDFLDYARRPRPNLRDTDMAALMTEVHELARPLADGASVELRLEVLANAQVAADCGQLRRAFLNIVQNAIQATPAGGEVRMALSQSNAAEVRISVSDNGKGIPPEHLDKIFSPFYTTKEKGSGLGLAFVKEILNDHEGSLEVNSTVDQGTIFTAVLRATAASPGDNEWTNARRSREAGNNDGKGNG
ncbi:MAG: HAMP domain-containing sensor histidine kinase [Pseudomonadota bacterium]